jgi:hypothetical protein
MNFEPHDIYLTGTLYNNCIQDESLSEEVWDWLFKHCTDPWHDRFYYHTGYTPGIGEIHKIRFDYREHSNWFLLRWS